MGRISSPNPTNQDVFCVKGGTLKFLLRYLNQKQNDTRLLWTTWSVRTVMSDSDGTKIKGIVKHILWMAEILHHLGCKRKPINTGINYQPQLVQDFFHQQYYVPALRFFVGVSLNQNLSAFFSEFPPKKRFQIPPRLPKWFLQKSWNLSIYQTRKQGSWPLSAPEN